MKTKPVNQKYSLVKKTDGDVLGSSVFFFSFPCPSFGFYCQRRMRLIVIIKNRSLILRRFGATTIESQVVFLVSLWWPTSKAREYPFPKQYVLCSRLSWQLAPYQRGCVMQTVSSRSYAHAIQRHFKLRPCLRVCACLHVLVCGGRIFSVLCARARARWPSRVVSRNVSFIMSLVHLSVHPKVEGKRNIQTSLYLPQKNKTKTEIH